MRFLRSLSRASLIFLCSLMLLVGFGAYWNYSHRQPPPAIVVEEPAPIASGEKPKRTSITCTGNGRDRLRIVAKNTVREPLRIDLRAGEIYDDGKNRVVLLRRVNMEVLEGNAAEQDLRTAAISSENVPGEGIFVKSSAALPKLDPLLRYLESHPAVPVNVIQTAVLVLAEDAPLDVFAKFPRLRRQASARFDSGVFKVDTAVIIATLQLLREIGVTQCAVMSDPQLQIEAMMDPRSHHAAMLYYGIGEKAEWDYWQHELREGEPSTRHYALYGIARFHPDIALQMMPEWVREKKNARIFRLAAIGALALTHRPEAEPILRKLQQEFAQETDILESTDRALLYLKANINRP